MSGSRSAATSWSASPSRTSRSATTPSVSGGSGGSSAGMSCSMAALMRALFWLSAGLLAYAQAGYGLLLAVLGRLMRAPAPLSRPDPPEEPLVSLIVAAYREERVIADKLRNALALDWPR